MSTVRYHYVGTAPSNDAYRAQIRALAIQAAESAGWDDVTVSGAIHATTSRGRRTDRPHLTATFRSRRYPELNSATRHIDVGVYDPQTGTYGRYQANNRPSNYPYHLIGITRQIRWGTTTPDQRRAESEERRRREESEERRRRAESEERRRRAESEERRRRAESEQRHRREASDERRRREGSDEKRRREGSDEKRRREGSHEKKRGFFG